LVLQESISAEDINNIIDAIKFEVVDRRSSTVTTVSIVKDDLVQAAKISTIIENLKKAGQTSSYSATQGAKIAKSLALDLIDKIKAANQEQINLP
jgi:hypothetical protein